MNSWLFLTEKLAAAPMNQVTVGMEMVELLTEMVVEYGYETVRLDVKVIAFDSVFEEVDIEEGKVGGFDTALVLSPGASGVDVSFETDPEWYANKKEGTWVEFLVAFRSSDMLPLFGVRLSGPSQVVSPGGSLKLQGEGILKLNIT